MAANQKIVLSVGVVAALVALVACQNLDPQECAKNVQQAAGNLRQSYEQILNQMMADMSKEATSAANMDRLTDSMRKLINQASSLADTSSGLNGQRLTDTMSQMASTYMEMGRTLMNAQPSINMMRIMMRAMASSTSAYTQFVMQVPDKCTP